MRSGSSGAAAGLVPSRPPLGTGPVGASALIYALAAQVGGGFTRCQIPPLGCGCCIGIDISPIVRQNLCWVGFLVFGYGLRLLHFDLGPNAPLPREPQYLVPPPEPSGVNEHVRVDSSPDRLCYRVPWPVRTPKETDAASQPAQPALPRNPPLKFATNTKSAVGQLEAHGRQRLPHSLAADHSRSLPINAVNPPGGGGVCGSLIERGPTFSADAPSFFFSPRGPERTTIKHTTSHRPKADCPLSTLTHTEQALSDLP